MVESNNEFSIQPPCIYTRLVHFDQKSEFQPGHQDSGVFLYVDVDRLFKKFSGVNTTTRSASKVSHSVHCGKQLVAAVRCLVSLSFQH